MAPLHVLLAEDNLLLRQGLTTLLADHRSVRSVRTADSLYGLLAAIVVAAVWSVVESWRVWRTDPDRQPF